MTSFERVLNTYEPYDLFFMALLDEDQAYLLSHSDPYDSFSFYPKVVYAQ